MERHDVLSMMTALKLSGMRAAYDEILADGLKRRKRSGEPWKSSTRLNTQPGDSEDFSG